MSAYYSAPVVLSSILDGVSKVNFSHWLHERLRASQIDQAEFARRYQRAAGLANPPTGRISEWATGKRIPSTKSVGFIAEVFGVSEDLVLTAAGHRPDVEPLDANDPRELLAQRVRRIHLREDDLAIMNRNLDIWEARNKREREEKL
jgi:hypothetical protein